MITANLRPTAMDAFFKPYFFMSLSPHTFKGLHDWFLVNKTTAASASKVLTSGAPHLEILPCLIFSPDEYCLEPCQII